VSRPTAYARRRVVAALVGFHAFGNLTCLGNPRTARAARASKRARRAGTLRRARVSTRRTRRGRARLRVDGAFREFAPAPATPDRLGARSSRHGTRWRAGVGTRRGFPRRASRVVGCCGDRPRGFVRNEIVRLITVLLRVVSVVQIKVARPVLVGRKHHARGEGRLKHRFLRYSRARGRPSRARVSPWNRPSSSARRSVTHRRPR